MRKSLASLALAAALPAAVALPAAGALTAAGSTAHAAKTQFERVKPHANVHLGRHQIRPNLTLRRCTRPRFHLYVRAKQILIRTGHRRIRYAGYYQRRCRQMFVFRACRGHRLYRVIVRFSFGRYAGMHRRAVGFCRPWRHRGHLRHRS